MPPASSTIINGTVSGNTASEKGGGIFVNVGIVDISGAIENNTANDDGGGVYMNGGSINFNSGNRVENNSANADNSGTETGGGIYHQSGTITGTPNYSGNSPDNCDGPGGC